MPISHTRAMLNVINVISRVFPFSIGNFTRPLHRLIKGDSINFLNSNIFLSFSLFFPPLMRYFSPINIYIGI